MIREGQPFRLIEGMLICAKAIGADRGYIYCRWEYPAAARTMSAAIAEVQRAGLLTVDGRPFSWKSSAEPAPMCAVRKRRCSRRSKADAV